MIMNDQELVLDEIQHLLNKSFPEAIVWNQKSHDFIGKYLYIKYEDIEIGVFLGCTVNASDKIKSCLSLYFTNPVAVLTPAGIGAITRLLHRLMIRANLKLKSYPFKIINGKYPAILRMIHFEDESNYSIDKSRVFFSESLKEIMKHERHVPSFISD